MKITLFALNGVITAVAFPGETSNFNGAPVHTFDTTADTVAEDLAKVAPSGVGSPWPPVNSAAAVIAQVTGLAPEVAAEVVAEVAKTKAKPKAKVAPATPEAPE